MHLKPKGITLKITLPKNPVVTALFVCAFLCICALVYLSTRPNRDQERWVRYKPDLVRGLWKKDPGKFLNVDEAVGLQKCLEDAVWAKLPPNLRTTSKGEATLDFTRSFLAAYSSGSFEAYWRFRAPFDRYRSKPQMDAWLQRWNNKLQPLEGADPAHPAENSKELIRQAWQRVAALESKARESKVLETGKPCARCFDLVRLDDIDLQLFDGASGKPNLKKLLLSQPNLGIFGYYGWIDALPSEPVARADTPEAGKFIYIRMMIKASITDQVHPVSIIGQWDEAGGKYIPVDLGIPSLAGDRLRLLF